MLKYDRLCCTNEVRELCESMYIWLPVVFLQGKRVMSCTKEEWPTLKQSVSDTYLMRFSDFNEHAVKIKVSPKPCHSVRTAVLLSLSLCL